MPLIYSSTLLYTLLPSTPPSHLFPSMHSNLHKQPQDAMYRPAPSPVQATATAAVGGSEWAQARRDDLISCQADIIVVSCVPCLPFQPVPARLMYCRAVKSRENRAPSKRTQCIQTAADNTFQAARVQAQSKRHQLHHMGARLVRRD